MWKRNELFLKNVIQYISYNNTVCLNKTIIAGLVISSLLIVTSYNIAATAPGNTHINASNIYEYLIQILSFLTESHQMMTVSVSISVCYEFGKECNYVG